MSQQLTISSAFSVLAMALMCVFATANVSLDVTPSVQNGWAQAEIAPGLSR